MNKTQYAYCSYPINHNNQHKSIRRSGSNATTAVVYCLFSLFFLFLLITTTKEEEVKASCISNNQAADDNTIHWKTCKSQNDNDHSLLGDGLQYHRMECADVRVPLDWTSFNSTSSPSSTTTSNNSNPKTVLMTEWICVHVKRLKSLSAVNERKGQVWIHSTPLFEFHKSIASQVKEVFIKESSYKFKEYDLYFPDIRGSGESTPKFTCEFEEKSGHSFTSEKDIEICLSTSTKNEKIIGEKYGKYFQTYHIVRDLFHIISMTRNENSRGFLTTKTRTNSSTAAASTSTSGGSGDSVYNQSEKVDGYRIIHYGYGFNTFLIGRMIQIEKEMKNETFIDMIIVDSVFSLNVSSIDLFNFDKRFNEMTLLYLEECDRDEFCSKRLEELHKSKGKISLRNLLNGIYLIYLKRCYLSSPSSSSSTSSSNNNNLYFFRDVVTYFFYEDELRHLLVPLLIRVSRCNDLLDRNVVHNFFYHISHRLRQHPTQEDPAEKHHEIYSTFERVIGSFELMDHTYKFYKEEESRALDLSEYPFFTGLSLNMMKTYSLIFHSSSNEMMNHSHTIVVGESHFTDFEKPLLLLHGSLDPFSSINNLVDWKDFYLNESRKSFQNQTSYHYHHHHVVVFPFVNHVTLLRTNCSMEIIHTFIKSGGSEYIHECLLEANASDRVRQRLFNESNWSEHLRNSTLKYFGTRDAIDGGLSISANEYYFLVVGLSVAGVLLIELFLLLTILLIMSIKVLK